MASTNTDTLFPVLHADPARWEQGRKLSPKGRRKSAQKGGLRKRRRKKYNLKNLRCNQKRQIECVCKVKCVCGPILITDEVSTQTDPIHTTKIMVDKATEIVQHTNMLPKAGTFTKGDNIKAKSSNALTRLKKAIPFGFHWSNVMIAVMLRLLFSLICEFNWNWTNAVYMTSKLLLFGQTG